MFAALDISTSALVAQRLRLTTISGNLANMMTTRNEFGQPEPYQPRFVVFEVDSSVGAFGASGVRVASVERDPVEPLYRYEPNHPDAIKSGPYAGYVAYPNINMMTEFTDALLAARAYEANLGAMEISKDMAQQTLRILG
ncbi:MAG: flagellar basal body rod protein FlgC [Thermoguttaceae bacterium]|nr:flagellar basal body rod protein FlgC [Thermoguttaceae bacterium]MDW8077448.1 flagellar basal body rod protein FlgC [Thermoguttaceae bacterium]